MNIKQRKIITAELVQLVARTSANRVAAQVGISAAAISQIVNQNWDAIGIKTWLLIETKLRIDSKWKSAETSNFTDLQNLLGNCQINSLALAIVSEAGCGKSHGYRTYARENDNVLHIECANYWSKREYIHRLLEAAGLRKYGTTSEMVARFINHLNTTPTPLVIIDQFDKLREPSLDLFMDLYNETHNKCGFILSGVRAMEKRIRSGVARNKIGYNELFSRVGRTFIKLKLLSQADVLMICKANGLENEDEINAIYNSCEGDIRRVRRSVERWHILGKKNFKKQMKDQKTA
ncbi:ATP-binding protein [Flavobacteriaceae bacterium]|nr:ATP-binding protein [Flavobacteriaceae bacterium]